MTITLEDVYMLLGLPVVDEAVTFVDIAVKYLANEAHKGSKAFPTT